jgi:ABC-type arginine transport system ATPase subunit
MVVEKNLIEMENILKHPVNGLLMEMTNDISPSRKKECLRNIAKARRILGQLFIKYGLYKHTTLISRFIDSRKSGIWEILCDTSSKRLKGYGEFPSENIKEFDNDINTLQKLIEKI